MVSFANDVLIASGTHVLILGPVEQHLSGLGVFYVNIDGNVINNGP